MRLFRPLLARIFYYGGIFRMPARENVLYLTFDDGPAEDSTEKILDVLDSYRIKALFFCSGKSAEELPVLRDLITLRGHLTGNHGYLHLDGFKTPLREYCRNAELADNFTSARIYRPPYGRLTLPQFFSLRKKYQLVFWDLMPYDFDRSFSAGESLSIIKQKMRPGSVIVLHDNPSSSVHDFLEEFIRYSVSEGYHFGDPAALIH